MEANESESELIRRLQGRIDIKPRDKQQKQIKVVKVHPRKPLPHIKHLAIHPKKSEGSEYSWVRYFLDGLEQGKTMEDLLPKKEYLGKKIEPCEKSEYGDCSFLNDILRKQATYIEDDEDDEEENRPNSPGKEYDVQYIPKPSEFKASKLKLSELSVDAREKLINSAKDVEKYLKSVDKPKRRRRVKPIEGVEK